VLDRADEDNYNPRAPWNLPDADICECGEPKTFDPDERIDYCRYCDGGEVRVIARDFNLHLYGCSEYRSLEAGLIAEVNTEMEQYATELEREGFSFFAYRYSDGKAKMEVPADFINSNPARQYFVKHNGREIGCITEEQA
tara:strand:- start:4735 stop:5154 length:420 start_codon:yes stop_codon:yes gene_type:complete